MPREYRQAGRAGSAHPNHQDYLKPFGGESYKFTEAKIFPPRLEHRKTFLILHPCDKDSDTLSRPLLSAKTPSYETIQAAFPDAKLIFPNAARSRFELHTPRTRRQWFNGWDKADPTKDGHLMREGLRMTCDHIHELLKQEIRIVGRKNVVLWGVEQGGAAALIALLAWDGEPFAAVVGIGAYFPFAEEIVGGQMAESSGDVEKNRIDLPSDGNGNDDVLMHQGWLNHPVLWGIELRPATRIIADENLPKQDLSTRAEMFLRKEIQMFKKTGIAFRDIPVFLGHLKGYENVPVANGNKAKICLEFFGVDVEMVKYKGVLGKSTAHAFSGEMLGDIFKFLRIHLEPPGALEEESFEKADVPLREDRRPNLSYAAEESAIASGAAAGESEEETKTVGSKSMKKYLLKLQELEDKKEKSNAHQLKIEEDMRAVYRAIELVGHVGEAQDALHMLERSKEDLMKIDEDIWAVRRTIELINKSKQVRRLRKTLRQIEYLEKRQASGEKLEDRHTEKIATKSSVQAEVDALEHDG